MGKDRFAKKIYSNLKLENLENLLQRAITECSMYKSCLIFLFAYKYNITHRLSQCLAALSRNSTEQGKRDDGDRGPGGNLADDDSDVKGRV